MRIALISTGERGEEPAPKVAGRSLLLRQLDFAQACGAERVIAHDSGGLEDATVLSEGARKAGLSFSVIASAHALVPLVGMEDELLVLQPRVLPEAPEAIIALEAGPAILAFPAGEKPDRHCRPFERIDAKAFWAGALLMPGELIARLEELPEDANAPAALLRIALQEGVRRTPLDRRVLGTGVWGRMLPESDQRALGAARVKRAASHLPGQEPVPSSRLAALALGHSGEALLRHRHIPTALLVLALLLLVAAPVTAWLGLASLAFGAIAVGGLLLELVYGAQRVALPAFTSSTLPRRLRYLPDLAIFATAVLAIEGAWFHRLFPPLVLALALLAIGASRGWRGVAGDRVLGAALVALAAIAGWQEPALMAWGLAAASVALLGGLASGTAAPGNGPGSAARVQRSDTGT